jgi:hypothetical protein
MIKSQIIGVLMVFSIGLFGSSVSASPQDININYETDLGHDNRTKSAIIEELTGNGLSVEDASFYAKMDILTAQMEKRGIVFEGDNVTEYDELYVKANKEKVRKEALDQDLKAIKSLLKINQAAFAGAKDIERAQKTNKGFKQEMNYEIKYPDGSSVSFYSKDAPSQPADDTVKTNVNDTELLGPWDESSVWYGSNFTADPAMNYTSTREWSYNYGVSYAKIKDILGWHHANGSTVIQYISDTGATSYAGVVSIDLEYLSNHQSGNNGVGQYVLQGYTDARFKVSGSFTASFGQYLSISVDAGAGWHQYCIAEILLFDGAQNAVGAYGYAGQFL